MTNKWEKFEGRVFTEYNEASIPLSEVVDILDGMKVGDWSDWISAAKEYGGTREEWDKLQFGLTWDEVLDKVKEKLSER